MVMISHPDLRHGIIYDFHRRFVGRAEWASQACLKYFNNAAQRNWFEFVMVGTLGVWKRIPMPTMNLHGLNVPDLRKEYSGFCSFFFPEKVHSRQ